MAKIKSMEDLIAIREKHKTDMNIRNTEGEEKIRIIIGMATCGIASGARETLNAMVEELNKLNITNASVIQSGCMGLCHSEPTVEVVYPDKEPILYGNVTPEKGREIIDKHIKKGELVDDIIIGKPFKNI